MPEPLTIGRLAERAGVGVETVRFYQREGLVAVPRRPPGGQRRYPAEVARRIAFIKRAQRLGFSLEEVRSLLQLEEGRDCGAARTLAMGKLEAIEARMADLGRMRRALAALVAECGSGRGRRRCPIIDSLHGPPEP